MLEDHTGNMDDAVEERLPAYPHSPEVYAKSGDDDPEKRFFVNRGAVYEGGRYVGGFGTRP